MSLATRAMETTPRDDNAITILLHAAARSDWVGDPQSLIPRDLMGGVQADLGMTEFLRRRELPGWEETTLEIARRHPDAEELKVAHSIAVLSLGIRWRIQANPAPTALSAEEINKAADFLKALVEKQNANGFGDSFDRAAHLNNASVLLRIANRELEAEQLLRSASDLLTSFPHLRRMRAICLIALNRSDEAIRVLRDDSDPENCLLRAELLGMQDPVAALEQLQSTDPEGWPLSLAIMRCRVSGDLALKANRIDLVRTAAHSIADLDPSGLEQELHAYQSRSENRFGEGGGIRTPADALSSFIARCRFLYTFSAGI